MSNNIPENNTNINLKLYLLDPLSVIIKLAIISNKIAGVKISISNNVLYIQEPTIIQGILRYYYKDNKSDLQYIYNPIELACNTFLTKEKKKNIPNIIHLFNCAQKGLTKLAETYKTYTVIGHCLHYYSNLISNYLSDHYNPLLYKKDSITCFYTNELLTKLNSRWSDDKIKIVLEMIDFLNHDVSAINNVRCLEIFMEPIDNDTEKIIDQI